MALSKPRQLLEEGEHLALLDSSISIFVYLREKLLKLINIELFLELNAISVLSLLLDCFDEIESFLLIESSTPVFVVLGPDDLDSALEGNIDLFRVAELPNFLLGRPPVQVIIGPWRLV